VSTIKSAEKPIMKKPPPSASKNTVIRSIVPDVGDRYDHATGVYAVDWVCGCDCDADGETRIGLCSQSMTWTGTVADLETAGFTMHSIATKSSQKKGAKDEKMPTLQ
jgi:hypothetical protein